MKPLLIKPIRFLKPYRFSRYKLFYLAITLLLITSATWAQSFRFQAKVDAIKQSGFHRILLPPDVVGRLNASLGDIRLYDNQQQEIPYRLIQQQPKQSSPFADYEIVSKQSRPNVATTLVVRNSAKSKINSLDIVIKNTNVGKKARLSGSSDAQTWYALDDAIWLEPTPNSSNTTDTKTLDFPLSDYEYYRLEVNDSLSTPLNILRIGHYVQKASAGIYSTIPDLTVSQRDSSDKHTYIHLTHPNDTRFDKLSIVIQANTPFRRRAELGQFRTRKLKRKRSEQWFETIRSFELTSADSNVVYLPGLKTKDLYIVIANDDNPPLKVGNVRAYQLMTYLLANLTVGSTYQLRFSADDALPPSYDQTLLTTNMSINPPIVNVGSINVIGSADDKSASFFTDSRIIWPALGIVLLLLGFLSYQMLREMGKSNQPNL